ncbi:hypothetical protein CEXT_184751 [Caerostris extrusa]|uniref:Uncharacterized protein n=1 Tax=Caerostris extrusa TaxID=172846 RepID=A0AAV4NTI9_CAEEX|nr:hypothetical protein CEXT_184751 [Caerostris extrusa]
MSAEDHLFIARKKIVDGKAELVCFSGLLDILANLASIEAHFHENNHQRLSSRRSKEIIFNNCDQVMLLMPNQEMVKQQTDR